MKAMILLAGFLMLAGASASAEPWNAKTDKLSYDTWTEVELPFTYKDVNGTEIHPSCGGEGQPYKFYVNHTIANKNLQIYFEGGGNCVDYGGCTGKGGGATGASNPDGLAKNYFWTGARKAIGGDPSGLQPLAYQVSPSILYPGWVFRWLHDLIFQSIESRAWSQVYLPYCTGDDHAGGTEHVFLGGPDNPGAKRTQYFHGLDNVEAAKKWLRDHAMAKPERLMVWGVSAGGLGAMMNYAGIRDEFAKNNPTMKSSLLNDSGALLNSKLDCQGPGKDENGKPDLQCLKSSAFLTLAFDLIARKPQKTDDGLPHKNILALTKERFGDKSVFDPARPGSILPALAQRYPEDRIGFAVFKEDKVLSAFYGSSTKAYEQYKNPEDVPVRDATVLADFREELRTSFIPMLDGYEGDPLTDIPDARESTCAKTSVRWHGANSRKYPNLEYLVPCERNLVGHTMTVLTYSGSYVKEGFNGNVGKLYNSLLSTEKPVASNTVHVEQVQPDRDSINLIEIVGRVLPHISVVDLVGGLLNRLFPA